MSGRLQGKVAIVTGAGCVGPGWGNGRAMAVRFAEEGAHRHCPAITPAWADAPCASNDGDLALQSSAHMQSISLVGKTY